MLYKWASTYVLTCEACPRTKSTPHTDAPLASLPVPSGCWQSISMDFVFGLPKDKASNTGIVVFLDHLSKMAHLSAVPDTVDGEDTAKLFLDRVFRQHGLPEANVSDRDPRFTAKFWTALFKVLGTKLDMSTADHPPTDGQTERVNRVVEDILRSVCSEAPRRWSEMLPLVEFAMRLHPILCERLSLPSRPTDTATVRLWDWWGGLADRLVDVSPVAVRKQVGDFVPLRLSVMRPVRDAMAGSQDFQKENAGAKD
ncbi:polyprotein [Phytophthora megakarya]|uniref:Polyprotein n=1 Tax=Phytophthora megakarya TaxID=4795 RepID=A0A225WJH7_9STRA|nr:polyprotein [Phytophthora megakarya]